LVISSCRSHLASAAGNDGFPGNNNHAAEIAFRQLRRNTMSERRNVIRCQRRKMAVSPNCRLP
jgi:hypothetical protein